MIRSSFLALVVLLAAGCTKKEEATATASATATAAAAPAAPTCPDAKATLHKSPPYCITAPGFAFVADEPFDRNTYAKLNKEHDEITTRFSKDKGDAKNYERLRDLAAADAKDDGKTILEEGKTPGDKGYFVVTKSKVGGDRWIYAIARSNERVVDCRAQDYPDREAKDALIAACKTLTPLDE
jgi:hypothetical protein